MDPAHEAQEVGGWGQKVGGWGQELGGQGQEVTYWIM